MIIPRYERNLLVTRKPPFDSPDLRQAVAMTIDHKAFIDILGEGQGDIGTGARRLMGNAYGNDGEVARL